MFIIRNIGFSINGLDGFQDEWEAMEFLLR